jgi:nucleotide-binding universal stress UspA family protein
MRLPVVVGFDGSTAADAAVRHGVQEAVQRGSELRIVHAFGWFALLPPMYAPYQDGGIDSRGRGMEEPAPQPRSGNPGTRADDMDIVEVWGRDSFPASDPPANW